MSRFLETEIQSEKESLKASGKAVQIKGFDVETKEAEVVLTKKFQDETYELLFYAKLLFTVCYFVRSIKIKVNVNHAVDAESAEEEETQQQVQSPPTKVIC